jgi:DNA-binding NtrC family response regulator
MNRILLIDDEEKLRNLMARIIGLEGEGFEVTQADSARSARKKLTREDFDVVICDVKLPDGDGVELIKEIKEKQPLTEVILLTAYGNIPDGVQAMKNGAFDYITKGDDNNKIIPLLHRAMDKVQLSKRVYQLEQQVGSRYSFDQIIAHSKAISITIALAKKVAPTDTSILLLGETGTGKEVFAQAIHQASKRNKRPFVALNCSAFSKELLESELFGYKAGAFTGALKDKKGLIEEADTGTLFLDEIGEMAAELQSKLLRVLENGEFLKVGDTKPAKVDIRIIAATNRHLEKEVDAGNFRSDLFYRLAAFQITLPPLRERVEDVEPMARYFAQIFSLKSDKKIHALAPDFVKALQQHQWRGNIRELKNVIERSVIMAEENVLTLEDLPYDIQPSHFNNENPLSALTLVSVEKLHIRKVLNYTQGNKTEAARLLNIGLTTLYRKIEEYKL